MSTYRKKENEISKTFLHPPFHIMENLKLKQIWEYGLSHT